jgi:ComF family protein
MGSPLLPALKRVGTGLLDALLPPQCLACGALVAEPRTLCSACWAGIEFIAPPLCARCGFPFEIAADDGSVCGACLASPPRYHRARAVFRYGEESRRLVLAFKHGDRIDAAPAYGAWMRRAASSLLDEAHLVAPVPLHRWRLLLRRYNQAALLGQALAHAGGRLFAPDLLERRRATPSQGKLSAAERRANVTGAFRVHQAWRPRLRGQRVLLVDDVLTTGATVEACAAVLIRAGAASVDVVTLARVVRPQLPRTR